MGKRVAETSKTGFWAVFTGPGFRKFQMVLIGVALAAASQGLLPDDISTWVLLVVGVLTATGVYAVPNKSLPQDDPKAEAETVDEVLVIKEDESLAKG